MASRKGHANTVTILLNEGADIDAKNNAISFERIQPPVAKNPVGRPHKVLLVKEDCGFCKL